MFTFTPRTDEELNTVEKFELLPKGEYEYKVLNVEERISKNNNQMLLVKSLLLSGNNSRTIEDNIVMTPHWAFKFKHFCESLGLHKAYESGQLDLLSLKGMSGKLNLDIEKGKQKDNSSEFFPDRNRVTDYIPSSIAKEVKDIFNDDIPF